jgi:hypothetical protein
MITITESKKTFQSDNGDHADDGTEILTCTVWADDECLDSFGGNVRDHDEIRAEALAFARKWDGVTGDQVRAYDSFVRKMDACDWNP